MLAACIVVCFLPGVFGGRFQPGPWYEALVKPAWTPPGWAFPVAWTVLYVLMGVSLWLALRAGAGRTAIAVFGLQLLLNGTWSWLFFGLQRPALALAEILVLWLLILASTVLFWRVRPLAGALLLPYLAWVGFAAVLNAALVRLNP
jgi:tryptophan-rich sensory protein